MKKLFVMTLAVAALASCSKVEPIEPGYKSAIGFGKSFVENTTKAAQLGALDKTALKDFAVWANESGAAILTNEKVFLSGSEWGYTNTRFWHPDNNYAFYAIAPFEAAEVGLTNNVPTTITYTLAGGYIKDQVDLLYATQTASTISPSVAPATVDFTFDHLLSKVQFTFTNGHVDGSNYDVKIKDVTITAKNKSTLTIGDNWVVESDAGNATLTFGKINGGAAIAPEKTGVSEFQSLLIPNTEVTIAGTAEIYVGATKVETRTISGTIPANKFASGVFYNITATIKSDNQIKFSVNEVNDWNSPATNVAM